MKAVLIIALFAVSALAVSQQFHDLHTLWSTWKSLHGKSYTDAEEVARYGIFIDNYNKIVNFNAKSSSVQLRLNKFADLTAVEFKHIHSGCATPADDETVRQNTVVSSVSDLPASVDWRTQGVVTPIKNQGQCGSCWTFSTTGVLEGFYAINTGKLLSFSEQQIVDCATKAGQGCSGGVPYLALQYAAAFGLEGETTYPYTGKNGMCYYDPNQATHSNHGYVFVPNYNSTALQAALVTMPVSVLVEADQNVFQFYASGVVGSTDGCGASLDHAVLAVGYGNIDGSDAFIVKNSWGEDWGQSGYIYLSTDGSSNGGAGVCGVLSQPLIPTA